MLEWSNRSVLFRQDYISTTPSVLRHFNMHFWKWWYAVLNMRKNCEENQDFVAPRSGRIGVIERDRPMTSSLLIWRKGLFCSGDITIFSLAVYRQVGKSQSHSIANSRHIAPARSFEEENSGIMCKSRQF